MGIECQKCEETMEHHQNHTSAECGEKSCRTIDCARKHSGKNHEQDGVERSLARERAFVSKPHCGQCDKKDNDPTQRNLNKCQILRFYPQTKQGFKRVPECIHRWNCIAEKNFVARMTTCSANQSYPLGADRFCLATLARETVAWHKTTARRI